jgi:hypothetical protein
MERNKDGLDTLGRKKALLGGCFRPNGTGAVLDASVQGGTVARTGVGTFVVTYSDKVGNILAGGAHFQGASSRRIIAVVDSIDLTAKTMTISLYNVNTDAVVEESASAQRVVRFWVETDDAVSL